MNLLANLNPEQLAAVTLPRQSALILAGAGSGKTKVLTTRMAWLIQTSQVSPFGIMAVTFTNKAAREMTTRIEAVLPINTRNMWVGTFHSLCHRMLRAHWREAGLPQAFQILDSADQLSAIKRLFRGLGINPDEQPPKSVASYINSCKEAGQRPRNITPYDAISRRMLGFYEAYEQQCAREGVVDFAELLLRSYELLQSNPDLAAHYQARFRYILVDEFQDTNDLQYAWLQRLAGPDACIFAVGDDDQSIYAFRGARVANMQRFIKDFQVEHHIKLEQNYRSVGNILKAANSIIEHNTARLGKSLWTESGEGEPLRVFEAQSDLDEARFVVENITRLTVDEGFQRSDFAILYRSNAQSRVLEQSLMASGIPYRVYGGLRYYDRAEVKHALAYLRLLANPVDDNAFLRVVNFPVRGIGNKSIEHLQDCAKQHGLSLMQAIAMLDGRTKAVLERFEQLTLNMIQAAQGLPLTELVQMVLEQSGLLAHYETEKDGEDRVDNLNELMNSATAFLIEERWPSEQPATQWDEARGNSILADFLANAALSSSDSMANEPNTPAVQLMTVHAAKGLEFECVFITGLEEGLFPHENSLDGVMDAGHGVTVDALEEERRLMYVAVTRARKMLYLTLAQQRMLHGKPRFHLASRFIKEIPEALLKWLSPKRGQPNGMGFSWADLDAKHGRYAQRAGHLGHMAYGSAVQKQSAQRPFAIGTGVHHDKFGSGVVVAYEGQGEDARIQVNFGSQGMKWLMLSLAKLMKT